MTTAPQLSVSPVSPVSCGAVLCRQGGILWATIVVKATFHLVHGGPARPIAPLPLVLRDQASAHGASLTHAGETAPHVPNAGVVLTGHAHAPDGRAVPSMSIRLGIFRESPLIDKTLHVFGSRAAANPVATMPFQKMPIVYERAFGGAGVWQNPVGTGGPGSKALPNIVDPKDPNRPAGFGPVSGQWAPRRGFLAGADPALLEQAIFEAPQGFDWRYFQAAPTDQQLDALRGDEWILLDGIHPQHARVQSRLPQVRAAARKRTAGKSGGADQPVELRADMLVIDADAEVASLVWRGRFAVESVDALRSMSVLAGLETPGRPIAWPEAAPTRVAGTGQAPPAATLETQEVNLAALLGGQLPFDGERAIALPPPAPARPRSLVTGTEVVDLNKLFQQPTPFAEAAATLELSAMSAERAFSPKATLERTPAHDAPALPFAPASAGLPPVAATPTPAAHKLTPMSTGTTDIDLAKILAAAAPFGARPPRTASAPLMTTAPATTNPPVVVSPAPAVSQPPIVSQPAIVSQPPTLARPPAIASAAPIATPAPKPTAPVFALPAVATSASSPPIPGAAHELRTTVTERVREGKSLKDLKLAGADLREMDFLGASLIGLDLQKANLAGAKLGDAKLTGARLCGANLTGADLSGADLGRADLSRATLANARFEGAVLIGAKLCDAEGKSARFNDARLGQADLTGAALLEASFNDIDAPGSTWEKASLGGAVFLGAKLRGASFQGASLDKTSFTQADLASSNFQRATGTDVDLRAAKLEAGDLRQAQLTNATFDDADLRDLSATRSDLSGGRFFRADLSGANLRAAKLNGADFTQAKTDGADFRDAEIAGIKIDPMAARLLKLRLPR